jgi:hypothetical protein
MRVMRPVALVRSLVETDTVCSRCSTGASGLVICVEMKTVDEIGGLIIEATEGVGGRLLNGTCDIVSLDSSLLGFVRVVPTQHGPMAPVRVAPWDLRYVYAECPTFNSLHIKKSITLLRSATQHAREGRRRAPHRLHPLLLLLPPFQSRQPFRVIYHRLLNPQHVGLKAPAVVAGSEGYALRVHRRQA